MTQTRFPQGALLLSLVTIVACDPAAAPVDPNPVMAERSACEAPIAEDIVLPPGFEAVEVLVGGPLTHISGMTLHPDGRIFVSDLGEVSINGDETILAIDPVTGSHDVIESGLPLGAPGRLAFSDGRAPGGEALLVADWNTNVTSACCGGRVLSVDLSTNTTSVLSDGWPGLSVGDPFGLALADSGYPGGVYVMDFQGASAQEPVLFRLDETGTEQYFASSGNQWPTDRAPRHIEFGSGDGFRGLYVVDGVPSNPTIWHVDDGGLISSFFDGSPLVSPTTARFGRGDAFGTGMYVLDSATKELNVIDAAGTATHFASGLDQTTVFSDMVFAPGCGTLYVGMGDRIVAIRPEGVGACTA